MRVWQRVLAYGAVLVVVLLVAIGIGRPVGPIEEDEGHGQGPKAVQRRAVAQLEGLGAHGHS